MEKWKTKIRFPTFPRGARDDYCFSVLRTKNQERRSAASRPPHHFSGSSCIGNRIGFQDHPSIGKCSCADAGQLQRSRCVAKRRFRATRAGSKPGTAAANRHASRADIASANPAIISSVSSRCAVSAISGRSFLAAPWSVCQKVPARDRRSNDALSKASGCRQLANARRTSASGGCGSNAGPVLTLPKRSVLRDTPVSPVGNISQI